MVQRTKRILSNIFLLFVFQLSSGFEYMFMDEKPDALYEESGSKVEEQKFNKRIEKMSAPTDVFKRNFHSTVGSRVVPVYQTTNHGHCSCEMNFQQFELGREYYPRYVLTGVCQPNSCEKYYQCIERKYKIKVLRKRDIKDGEEIMSASLPKPLRDFWVAETIPVGVSCECVMDMQIPYADSV